MLICPLIRLFTWLKSSSTCRLVWCQYQRRQSSNQKQQVWCKPSCVFEGELIAAA